MHFLAPRLENSQSYQDMFGMFPSLANTRFAADSLASRGQGHSSPSLEHSKPVPSTVTAAKNPPSNGKQTCISLSTRLMVN